MAAIVVQLLPPHHNSVFPVVSEVGLNLPNPELVVAEWPRGGMLAAERLALIVTQQLKAKSPFVRK